MPKVSVLMYVRNGLPYFYRSIKSVMGQTLRDIEILVIDGGSTDGTLAVVGECQKIDTRIRLLHCDKGSVGAQFNLGVKEAKGEYIGIVEADDYVLPQMYEEEYLCAKKNNSDVLRADNYIFFESNGEEIRIRTEVSHNLSNYEKNFSAKQEADKVLIGGSYWTGLYRREFLLKENIHMNETKGAAYQDFGFLFLTSVLAESVYFMKEAFYCYRKDNAMSSCNNPQGIGLVHKEFEFIREQLQKRGLWSTYWKYYYLWSIRNERWFYKNLRKDMKEKYIDISYEILEKHLEECEITGEVWNKKEQEFVDTIKQSKAKWKEYLKKSDEAWDSACEALRQIKKGDRVYLFGAGNLGEIIWKYLVSRGIYPIAFVDNNVKVWGMKKNDLEIIPFKETVIDEKTRIIICSENYAKEIELQLLEGGFTRERLIVCNDMDSCVRFLMHG